jgi:mono/diheme cytochrome c family protein
LEGTNLINIGFTSGNIGSFGRNIIDEAQGASFGSCQARRRLQPMLVAMLLVFGWHNGALADPKTSYLTRCSMCHQSNAQGLPGQFPQLAGRSAQIAQTPEGRRYLVRVALWGIYGPIDVNGTPINGLMPGVASASDAEISDVLNHVIGLGKPAKAARPFKPAEVAAVRAEGKVSGTDNAALRKTLVAAGVVK